jgi:isoprenylcysteine carboxyl methyltransferase (ICMT) family protein YpbQ
MMEIEAMEPTGMSTNSAKTVKADGGNEYGLTDREYYTNVVLFCLLFSCFSFNFWLTDF